MLAQSIITKAQAVLQDTGVRWPLAELLGWVNDGQREIASLRPDAYSASVSFQLAEGAKQALPVGASRLEDATRNLGADGLTPGASIRVANKRMVDAVEPSWQTRRTASVIQHVMADPREPRVFWVYPPAAGTSYIELLVARTPADVAAASDALLLADEFGNALVDYVLCRAFSKDADFAGNADRAVLHRRAFDNSLGLKAQADASSAPTA